MTSPNRAFRFGALLLGAAVLAGCGGVELGSRSTAARSADTTAIPSDTSTPAPAASAPATATATATDDTGAIRTLIGRANDEQVQALARHDPTLMRDTATDSYYAELAQAQRSMEQQGVASIRLVSLDWGDITVDGATAHATTWETWQTTLSDGSTERERAQNIYTLVRASGGWRIQTDDHPDSKLDQPATSAAPGGSTSPAPAARVPGTSFSNNWSGYGASGGTFTAVGGSWTVPQVGGTTAGAADAPWVGIGGQDSRDLIQAGTDATVLSSGRVRYSAWIEMLPDAPTTVPLTVSPGDKITVSIARQSGDNWLIAFSDDTTGQTYSTNVTYTSSLSSAEWIEEAPSSGRRTVPLSDFGTVAFTDLWTVKDGRRVTAAGANATPITMISSSRNPIAQPSTLTANGAEFTVTRVADTTGTESPVFPGRRTR